MISTGEAAAERAVAKMQAKPLPNPFAPLQQMQQQQQHGISSSSAHSQGVFASMNSAKPSPPPFSIPPAPPPSLYVKALPLTQRNKGSAGVTADDDTLIPSEEHKVLLPRRIPFLQREIVLLPRKCPCLSLLPEF